MTNNNPVMFVDPDGRIAAWLVSGLVCGAASVFFDVVGQAFEYYLKHNLSLKGFKVNKWSLGWSFGSGFVSGAFMMGKAKKFGQGLVGGFTTAIASAGSKKNFNFKNAIIDFVVGATISYWSGNGAGAKYYQKNWFSKGGMYVFNNGKKATKSLSFNMVVKDFAVAFGKYLAGPISGLFTSKL